MISAFQRFFTPHFFAPHLRLIYLFLWGVVISALSKPSLLLWLNGITLILLVILIYRSRDPYFPYLKRWLVFNIFTLLLWVTLSWRIGADGYGTVNQFTHEPVVVFVMVVAVENERCGVGTSHR